MLVDVDVDGGGLSPQPRHRHDLAAEQHEPAGSCVGAYVAHVHRESCRCVEERRIVREREVGLRHADRQFAEPMFREARDPLFGEREKVDVVGAVHPPGDRVDFVREDGKLKRQAAHLLVAGRAGQVQLSPEVRADVAQPGLGGPAE